MLFKLIYEKVKRKVITPSNIMKNKIWFFGDCFTWGWGCYPEQPYYEYKKEGDVKNFKPYVLSLPKD